MALFRKAKECQFCGALKKWLPSEPSAVTFITSDVLETIILQCYGSCKKFVCHSCAQRDRSGPSILFCPECGGTLAQPMK
jgi:hypothetical protein